MLCKVPNLPLYSIQEATGSFEANPTRKELVNNAKPTYDIFRLFETAAAASCCSLAEHIKQIIVI